MNDEKIPIILAHVDIDSDVIETVEGDDRGKDKFPLGLTRDEYKSYLINHGSSAVNNIIEILNRGGTADEISHFLQYFLYNEELDYALVEITKKALSGDLDQFDSIHGQEQDRDIPENVVDFNAAKNKRTIH
jgi:hypothetical protein